MNDGTYNLSIVNITADQYKDAINQIAELFGCGSNSLSVKLLDVNNNIFWGCQSYWNEQDYATFCDPTVRAEVIPPELLPALDHLYERKELNGDGYFNWVKALDELGLTVYEEPML